MGGCRPKEGEVERVKICSNSKVRGLRMFSVKMSFDETTHWGSLLGGEMASTDNNSTASEMVKTISRDFNGMWKILSRTMWRTGHHCLASL